MAAGAQVQQGLFARKSAEALPEDASDNTGLRRAVGTLDLTALGIGAIIGTGIFVIIGEAIGKSGPAIVISFVVAGLTCLFSALSYAELASTIPVSGSAYTYSYATLGELVAWIIGWDLIIEYGFSVAVVAVGWGGYLQDLVEPLRHHDPRLDRGPPGDGGTFNLPAVVLVLAIAALLTAGVRESARANTVMVVTKLAILCSSSSSASPRSTAAHFTPFQPHGFGGTMDAAALIFFAYIGFDAVSTSGSEARNPGRDLPKAIIGSLLIATAVYILVAVAAIGLTPADKLAGSDAPLTDAIRQGAGLGNWAGDILSFGALVAITSVVLTVLYGQTRIFFSMSRDGLVPRWFSKLNARRTPVRITVMFGVLVAALAAFIPLERARRAGQHRHAVRVPAGEHRRDRPAAHDARHGARLPDAAGAGRPADRRGAVHLADDEAAGGHVVAVRHLARHRPGHLLRLRPAPLARAGRRRRRRQRPRRAARPARRGSGLYAVRMSGGAPSRTTIVCST